MPNYRRAREGSTYFFTVVTYERRPMLCLDESRKILREVIKDVRSSHPFAIKAWVLLPDHIHCIWELNTEDINYSMRWGLIKKEFTKGVRHLGGTTHLPPSRSHRREHTVWQRRFWEHQIRDENDFAAHCHYVHYNPVKYGLVKKPADWPYSTFHKFLSQGIYSLNWGALQEVKIDLNIGHE